MNKPNETEKSGSEQETRPVSAASGGSQVVGVSFEEFSV